MFSKLASAATLALAATLVSAQTHTDCDPTKTACSPDAALGGTHTTDFRKGADSFWEIAEGTKLTYDPNNGAVFTINGENDAPTITSSKYIFFGKIDVVVQASLGTGVVTSFVLQSDDLDEIDWEWLGGDAAQVQTNYFSRGCTDVYDRGGYSPVSDPQHNFDTYTVEWTQDYVKWSINGNVVRTLSAASASGCDGFPQTPMQIKLGTWVAGKQGNPEGTVQWAGGYTNFADAPFMGYYQSITIQDYAGGVSGATEYVYGDHSGTWQSIKVVTGEGNSTSSTSSSSSSSSASSKTTTSAKSSSTATTMSTKTSSSLNATVTDSSSSASGTGAGAVAVATTTSSSPSSSNTSTAKNAAGNVALSLGSVAVMGAAALLGSLVL